MLMTHCSSQRKLHINRERDCDGQSSDGGEFYAVDINLVGGRPKACCYQRNHHQQREKGLRDARVKDADFIFEHSDTQATENSLQDYTSERNYAEVAHPSPAFAAPKPDRQNDREKSNGGSNQAMGMLKHDPADPI